MWVQADDDLLSLRYMAAKVFDLRRQLTYVMNFNSRAYLICIMIRRSNFNSCRKVEDDAVNARAGLAPYTLDDFADFQRKLQFRLGKGLRAVLVTELRPV
jgi:hypothetical protein